MKSHTFNNDILIIENLGIDVVERNGRTLSPVRDISFAVTKQQVTAIVGESGSGKTLTALAVMGLLPSPQMRMWPGSRINFIGRNMLNLSEQELQRLRGKEIAMVSQDPGASLNPVLRVGNQITQTLREHLGVSRQQARSRAIEILHEVGIASPELRINAYPHELSGGQKQRVMIAMAISCEPQLLIADEPTSALDVTVQRQILDLIARLQQAYGLSVIFITHDLGIAAEIADHVVVMRGGVIKEQGDKEAVLFSSSNEYTQALIAARVRLGRKHKKPSRQGQTGPTESSEESRRDVVLVARGLKKDYSIRLGFGRQQLLPAVKSASFTLGKGETVGIVGESGSGKTTLAMMVMRLIGATAGSVAIDGQDVLNISQREFRPFRQRIQIVFQNPYASLNPRWNIRRTLTEPMKLHGLGINRTDREEKAARLLERVGLPQNSLDKYPREFSGGERQRIAIARCLTVEPEILICDECVSALDISIQLQILDLLRDLQAERGVSYLFISHDLAVVRYMADRVLVMHDGEIVESAATESIFTAPSHPYTQQLLAAIPAVAQWL